MRNTSKEQTRKSKKKDIFRLKTKLIPKAIGRFQIIDKCGENAYKIDLLVEYSK